MTRSDFRSDGNEVGVLFAAQERLAYRVDRAHNTIIVVSLGHPFSEAILNKADVFLRGIRVGCVFCFLLLGACKGPKMRQAPPVLSREQAIQLLNDNADKLVFGLRSRGMSVSGRVLENGKVRRFDFRGSMLFVAPRYFWLEMEQLGEPVMQFGSNEEEYWAWVKMDVNKMWAGHQTPLADAFEHSEIPIHPDHLIESLGLARISTESSDGPLFLVDEEYNRLVFFTVDEAIGPRVSRTYFIDRFVPHMIRRIVYRRPDGTILMTAQLDDHRPVSGDGPLLAHHIRIDWPVKDSFLDIKMGPTPANLLGRTDQWKKLTRDHPYFVRPTNVGDIEWLDEPEAEEAGDEAAMEEK